MKTFASCLASGVLLAFCAPAVAGLPGCDNPQVAERARFQFDDTQDNRQPPSVLRTAGMDQITEIGQVPYVNALAPRAFEKRYCEAMLQLDDGTPLKVFILIIGQDQDGKAAFEGLEACWKDPRFARLTSCKEETFPGR